MRVPSPRQQLPRVARLIEVAGAGEVEDPGSGGAREVVAEGGDDGGGRGVGEVVRGEVDERRVRGIGGDARGGDQGVSAGGEERVAVVLDVVDGRVLRVAGVGHPPVAVLIAFRGRRP